MSLLQRILSALGVRSAEEPSGDVGVSEASRPPNELAAELTLTANVFQEITGHPVDDLQLYVHAMRHRSLLRGREGSAIESNERLEYLGDAVLGFVTAEHLYRHYPEEAEGFLTRLRSKLVNGKALADHARTLGLDRLIMVSDNLRQQGQTKKFTGIMADAFEALIGAIYLDQGTEAARTFINTTMLEPLDLDELMLLEDNPKSLLLEFAQARSWPQPLYRVTDAVGPSHQRMFTVEVVVCDQSEGSGQAGSKKQAEQIAAAEALQGLRASEARESESPSND